MKKIVASRLLGALFITMLFAGCLKDKMTKTYTIFTPVYMSKAEAFANVKSSTPQQLRETGKIYLYGPYIFLNELNKGVHIIDNTNPTNPKSVGFISIPGNIDIAVKGNTLFADLYTDLLSIDITDPLHAKLTKVVPNVFPERQFQNGFRPDSTKVIIDWMKKDTTVDWQENTVFNQCNNCGFALSSDMANKSFALGNPGIGGSMARFAIVNDYLYAVNLYSLGVLDIKQPALPVKLSTTNIGSNIETIYPFKDKLFIGSSAGMFIYDISNATVPVRKSQFTHARACDPVVADDNYAYVTLRTGSFCTGTNNQLDVINVQNILAPSLVKTYPMTNPHGLSKDGNVLFLCDGKDGLKVYDASNPGDLKLLQHLKGLETYDAIAWNKKLIVVATGGLYQYDYSNPSSLQLLSKIATGN